MNDLSNNKLFFFMRSVLRQEEQKQSDWTTPPDHVFEDAMVRIGGMRQKEKRSRLAIVLFIAASVFLLGGAASIWVYLDNMHGKINTLEQRVAAYSAEYGEEDKVVEEWLPAEKDATAPIIDALIEKIKSAEKRDQTFSSISDHSTIVTNSNKTDAMADVRVTELASYEPQPQPQPTEPAHIYPTLQRGMIAVNALAQMDARLTTNTPVEPGIVYPEPTLMLNAGGGHSKFFRIGAAFTTNFSTLSMRDVPGDAPEITDYDNYYSGVGVGMTAEYVFGKSWTAVVGFDYYQANSRSRSFDEMEYLSANETLDGAGNLMYLVECDLETPLGYYSTLLQFYTDQLNATDGDIMTSITGIEQSLNVWTTSLGVRYALELPGRIGFYVGGGGSASHVMKSEHLMYTNLLMENKPVMSMESETDELAKLARRYFSVYGEGGVRFSLTERIGLTLAGVYAHSLTSLRKGTPTTFLSQVNLDLGLAYQF